MQVHRRASVSPSRRAKPPPRARAALRFVPGPSRTSSAAIGYDGSVTAPAMFAPRPTAARAAARPSRRRRAAGPVIAALAVALASPQALAAPQPQPDDNVAAGADQPAPAPAGDSDGDSDGDTDANSNSERLTLRQLIARSLASARARMAKSATDAARAQAAEARGARLPSLSVQSFLAPSPDIDCTDANCTRTRPDDISLDLAGVYGGAQIAVVQPLYSFGKLDAIGRAARAATVASEHLEDALAGDLALEAARAYYGLKLARELIWMLDDGLAQIDRASANIEAELSAGSAGVTVQDRLRIGTLRAEIEARMSEAREAEAIALAGIRALVGQPDDTAASLGTSPNAPASASASASRNASPKAAPNALIDIDDAPLTAVPFDLADPAEYLDQAKRQRPEVRAAQAGVTAARAQAEFEQAHWWPDVVALGAFEIARAQGVDNPPSAFANDPFNTTSAAVAVALRWQLNPWRQRPRVERAQAQARRAEALGQLAGDLAAFEVGRAYAQARAARDRLEAAERGLTSARGWVASVMQAEAIGAIESKDFADALVAFFTIRARQAQSAYDWNLAIFSLRRALGEFRADPTVKRNR